MIEYIDSIDINFKKLKGLTYYKQIYQYCY